MIILLALVVVIVVSIIVAFLVTGNTAKQDYIKIGKDEVPSVKLILGEERNITGVSSSVTNGVRTKEIKYSVTEHQSEEMFRYAQALVDNYGFYSLNDSDFTGDRGYGFEFAKESSEDGYIVIVRIDYDRSGYTITLSRGVGTLTLIY